MDDFQKEREETPILDTEAIKMIIPECCREGWETCTHVVRRAKQNKNNIGL